MVLVWWNVAAALFIVANELYRHSSLYRNGNGRLKTRLERMGKDLDVVALGSTQAFWDFSPFGDYATINGKYCGNLAENPQSLRSSADVLRENLYRMKPNSQLLITPPQCTFFLRNMKMTAT